MHRPLVRTLLAALILTLTTACASMVARGPAPTLEGTTWRIVEVDRMSVSRGSDLDLSPHLRVFSDEGRVHGATGCNRFSAAYQATGQRFSLGAIASTRALCGDPERQTIEDAIMDALETVDSYRMEGDWLWLFSGGDHRLTLEVW